MTSQVIPFKFDPTNPIILAPREVLDFRVLETAFKYVSALQKDRLCLKFQGDLGFSGEDISPADINPTTLILDTSEIATFISGLPELSKNPTLKFIEYVIIPGNTLTTLILVLTTEDNFTVVGTCWTDAIHIDEVVAAVSNNASDGLLITECFPVDIDAHISA